MTSTLVLSHPDATIRQFAAGPDGYAVLGIDRTVRSYALDGTLRGKAKAGAGGMIQPRAVRFGPDGLVVTASTAITAWDPKTMKPVRKWKGHGAKSEVAQIVFGRDGETLVTGARVNLVSKANGLRIWDYGSDALLHSVVLEVPARKAPCQARELVRPPRSDRTFVLSYSQMSSGDPVGEGWYVHACDDEGNAVRVVDAAPPSPLDAPSSAAIQAFTATKDHLILVRLTRHKEPGGQAILSADWDLLVYDHDGTPVSTLRTPQVWAMAASSDGARLAVIADGLQILALPSLEVVSTIADAPHGSTMQFTPDDDALLVGASNAIHRVDDGSLSARR